jgi:hypothetical protein
MRWINPYDGPSDALYAWRRFVVETLLLFELLAVIGVVGLSGSSDLFAGAVIATLVAAVLRILHQRGGRA